MNFVSLESHCLFPRRKYIAKLNFENCAEIPATTSGHLLLRALIKCNFGQHFAGNGELFPV